MSAYDFISRPHRISSGQLGHLPHPDGAESACPFFSSNCFDLPKTPPKESALKSVGYRNEISYRKFFRHQKHGVCLPSAALCQMPSCPAATLGSVSTLRFRGLNHTSSPIFRCASARDFNVALPREPKPQMSDGHFPCEPIEASACRSCWRRPNSRDFAPRNPFADLELMFELDLGLRR